MKTFLWDNKKATMNWKEASQPREIGGLNMPNIETRIEAIQIMWLKKYLALKYERPDCAYVVDQIIFNNVQKNPKITRQNRISWIFQSWNETGKKDTIPKFISEMIKIRRKYKIGYDVLEAGPKPRQLLPIWHHIGIEDNYSWNKKLTVCLRKKHNIIKTGELDKSIKSNSTHWFCKRLAKRIMNKITECLRPGEEIYQNTISTPIENKDNLSSRTDVIKINPRIVDNRTPKEAIRIFGSYQRYKKRNNKENNFIKPLIKIINTTKEEKTIWITEISEKTIKEQEKRTEESKMIIGWKEKDETNEEERHQFFKVENGTPKDEREILLITEAIKEKGKITIITNLQKVTMDIHDKIEQQEQLDYLETKNKKIWRNLEYHIRKHEGEILLGPLRDVLDIKILEELEQTTSKREDQREKKLEIEEIPIEYKIEGAKIRQLTQKTAYKLILQEKNLKPEGKLTQKRIEDTCEEHKRKTRNRITSKDIWEGIKNKKILFRMKDFIWKLIHNHHKVGNWFKRIPNWQDKAICECGKVETMDHILIECRLNKSKDIWQEAEKIWKENNRDFKWTEPSVNILRGLGAIKLKERDKIAPNWINERYIEIVAETTWIIWTTRNKEYLTI